jgi:hypothetical protein
VPEPTIFPELPWSLDALILTALRRRLLADAPLRTVFRGEDQVPVLEMAEVLRTESFTTLPLLGLCLLADEERDTMSSYGGMHTTVLRLPLVTSPAAAWSDTQDLLRSRIVAQVRRVVHQNQGVLKDDEGRSLTEAVTYIRRVPLDTVPLPSGLHITLIDIEYRSQIDLLTQEVLP